MFRQAVVKTKPSVQVCALQVIGLTAKKLFKRLSKAEFTRKSLLSKATRAACSGQSAKAANDPSQ